MPTLTLLQRYTLGISALLMSVVLLIPSPGNAATAFTCDCFTVWGTGFPEDQSIVDSMTSKRPGGICTHDQAGCGALCAQLKTEYEGRGPGSYDISTAGTIECVSTPDSPVPGTTTTDTKPAAKVVKLTNPLGVKSAPELISNIISALLGFVGAVALLMFVYGGLLWLTSGGSADKVNKGREVMVWASIGLVIIFTSYGLVRFVFGAFSNI